MNALVHTAALQPLPCALPKGLNMSGCRIDHITVTASSLELGAEFVRQSLGVAPQAGGKHPRMGTHNLLLRLGSTLYLEVISPDQEAPPPSRPRWFELDRLDPRSLPRLATWAARTDDIRATVSAASEVLGDILPMSRGALNWRITVPADGTLPLHGAAPVLIEWESKTHPAAMLQDHGLSLAKLEIVHPEPERVSRLLRSIDCNGPLSVSSRPGIAMPYLVAHINTSHGIRELPAPGT